MASFLTRLGAWFRLPRPEFDFSADGLRLRWVSRYWPPWRRTWEETTLSWPDVVRIAVRKWDALTTDVVAMVFETADRRTVVVSEDDIPDFYSVMETILPRAFPGIADPAKWYADILRTPFVDAPTVIYEASPRDGESCSSTLS